ncbi:MAG: TlpA disulfide reductase family protein [Ferruginibacter sp.]
MIKLILPIIILSLAFKSKGQNAKQLLQQSYSKCLTIKNGYYDMEKSMKWMDEKDTVDYGRYKFYFKKLKDDSLYSIAFNSELIFKGDYIRNVMYTGNEYVTFSKKDSSAQIISNAKWAKTIMDRRHNDIFNFYLPFTNEDCMPLPKKSDYTDGKHVFKFIAKELQNNILCYHIQMIEYPKYDSSEMMNILQTEYDYWINIQDQLPIKYTASSKILNSVDTLNEYLSYSLKEYTLNNLQGENLMQLQLSSIPAYCNLQDYIETEKIALLGKDELAPDWTLHSLDNKKISLSNYKGQIVLIDFFYKSCYPCLKALPILQSLHQKYKSKGLAVLGIDIVDRNNNELETFLSRRGIDYKILLADKDVANDYKISVAPTIYLIDRNGKILYANAGFDETFEGNLEYLIKSNL